MMEEKKSFVGIDISKDRLDIAERPTGESWSVNNDNQEIEELVQRMKKLQPGFLIGNAKKTSLRKCPVQKPIKNKG